MSIRSFLLAVVATALSGGSAAAAPITPPSVRFDGASAGDLAGLSVAPAGDVNGDGKGDVVIGAPGAGANRDGTAAGAAYVVFGPFAPGETIDLAALGTRGITLSGSGRESAGRSVAGAGDVNGDGFSDVIVGAPSGSPGQEGPQTAVGRAYVLFGSRTPHDVELSHLGGHGLVLEGASHQFPDAFGWKVTGLGDIDHDGNAEVGVVAPGNPGFESDYTRGRAYVIFGRAHPGTIRVAHAGRGAFRIGMAVPGQLSSMTAAGDWNRDGHRDIAVVDGYAAHGRGAVFVVYGRRYAEPVDLAHLGKDGVTITGHYLHFRMGGAQLAGAADVDGDRRADVVMGEPAAYPSSVRPPAGSVWVLRGAKSRRETVDLREPGTRAWELARGARGSMAGAAIGLGSFGGSARADVVTIADKSVVVLYGTSSRTTLQLSAGLPASRGFTIAGLPLEPPLPATPLQPNTDSGGFTTVAAAGDLDGNGRDDILAGSFYGSHEGRDRAGVAYLFFTPGA